MGTASRLDRLSRGDTTRQALHGPERDVIFCQEHTPEQRGLSGLHRDVRSAATARCRTRDVEEATAGDLRCQPTRCRHSGRSTGAAVGNAGSIMVGLLAVVHDRVCDAEPPIERSRMPVDVPDLTTLQQRFKPASMPVPDVTVSVPAAIASDALLVAPQEWLRS